MTLRILCSLFLVAGAASCGDDDGAPTCGVTDQTVSGATLTAGGTATFGYGNFIWGQNNDCGTSSVTIRGGQTSPEVSQSGIGVCVKNPGAIGASPVSFADRAVIELVGASASGGGCTFSPAIDALPIGSVTFEGFCTTAGTIYKVTFAALVPGRKVCGGGAPEGVQLDLAGTALVRPQ